MDIRTALRVNKSQGTKPQSTVTLTDEISKDTPLEENGKIEETYGGNIVVKEYMDVLKKNDINTDDIKAVLETIITTNNLEWADSVFNNKVSIRFKMRSGWLEDIIAKKVDELAENKGMSMGRFTGAIRMLNIAASMTHYNGKDLVINSEDDFNERYKFVESLPYPILVAIGNKLAVFDRVVAVAMSDWALENFTEPQKEDS